MSKQPTLRRSKRLNPTEQTDALEQPTQPTVTRAKRPKQTVDQKLIELRNEQRRRQALQVAQVREGQLNLLDALPSELFCKTMDMLELWEQFSAKRVCHSWANKIDSMLVLIESLKLNVKKKPQVGEGEPEPRAEQTWEPSDSQRKFEFIYKEPELSASKQAKISLWDRTLNPDTVKALGLTFSRLKTLLIYWDSDNSDTEAIQNLVRLLLSQKLNREWTTLGFIFSGDVTHRDALSEICATICAILAIYSMRSGLNMIKFVSVKRLQLLNIIEGREQVKLLLSLFPNVEQLDLKFYKPSKETFGLEWIRVFKPLRKLTELSLLNFNFERKDLGWRLEHIDEFVNLAQVRKLTVASYDLFFCLRKASSQLGTRHIPQLKPEDIGDTIQMRFPGLQELNMWSGDARLHYTSIHESIWEALEQRLNRDLPLSLPLLPGLRVNIRLDHPVMATEFFAQSTRLFADTNISIFESNRLQRIVSFAYWNGLVERRARLDDILADNDASMELVEHWAQLPAYIPLQRTLLESFTPSTEIIGFER